MSADPLVIDGMRAVELARLTQGLPGWPGLHRLAKDGWCPVPLDAAENDLAAGWGVDCYAYPVPRERVEAELADGRIEDSPPWLFAWLAKCRAALRGDEDAILAVAGEFARIDRELADALGPRFAELRASQGQAS
jgi:hypothetical protein